MNKDGCYTSVHMHQSRYADLFEDICMDRLPDDDIFVLPQHQPINPEDEDDVVPDQHAAFGIQKATQTVREPAWKDLGLDALMRRGPTPTGNGNAQHAGNTYAYYAYYYGYSDNGLGATSSSGQSSGRAYKGLPR